MAYNVRNKVLRHRPWVERTSAQSPPGIHPGGFARLCALRDGLCAMRLRDGLCANGLGKQMPPEAVSPSRIAQSAPLYLCAAL